MLPKVIVIPRRVREAETWRDLVFAFIRTTWVRLDVTRLLVLEELSKISLGVKLTFGLTALVLLLMPFVLHWADDK
jgi:hypothetical protein